MDLNQIRADTASLIQEEDFDLDYLTAALIADYEANAVEDTNSDLEVVAEDDERVANLPEGARPTAIVYGHHPGFAQDLSKPGYVGKLFITNGADNRPNAPCGTMYRRVYWCRYYPFPAEGYERCGIYWSFKFYI